MRVVCFFQAEDGIRDLVRSRGLGDVYKRQGFTCYRERQEPLEFNGLSLFAIAGPTGAGKSSILSLIHI